MTPLLSSTSENTIIQNALRFDGYQYAKEIKPNYELHLALNEMLGWVLGTGKLFSNPLENFAVNFYLHRNFHHQGILPSPFSPEWYQMVFFYLHLYRLPTPAKYIHLNGSEEWENRKGGAAEAAATEIRMLLMEQGSRNRQ